MGETTNVGEAVFVDLKGDKWVFPFDFEAMKRVKKDVGVDLLRAIPRTGETTDDGEEPLLVQLDFDVVLMVDVWFALLRPQLEDKGISAEEFGTERVAPKIYQQVASAFWAGYHDFFQALGWEHVTKAIQEQQKVMPQLRKRASDNFGRAAELTLKSYDANVAQKLKETEDEIASISGNTGSD